MEKFESNIYSFKPVINNNSEVLILGSIPGKISLERQEYYGNKRNQFWDIMGYCQVWWMDIPSKTLFMQLIPQSAHRL